MEETGGAQYRTHAANTLHEKKLNQAFLRSNEDTNDQEFLVGGTKSKSLVSHSCVKSGRVIIV